MSRLKNLLWLAGAVPAVSPAAVIYSGIQNLSVNSGTGPSSLSVDVDGNSVTDFDLSVNSTTAFFASVSGSVLRGGDPTYAHQLGAMETVGPVDASWAGGSSTLTEYKSSAYKGEWAPPNQEGRVGFVFLDGSDVHYAWARVRVDVDTIGATTSATAIDWAYESQVDTPLSSVPEPSSLALLATGAAGLAILRTRRKKV